MLLVWRHPSSLWPHLHYSKQQLVVRYTVMRTQVAIPRGPDPAAPLFSSLGALGSCHCVCPVCREQVEFSRQLHPGAQHDAAIYDSAGLLTPRAIFAHGTQLTEDALQLMAAKGAAVAHCPLSNFYFGDGLFCVAQALAYGLKVGLGTDVAGGYSPSMLQAVRMAIINSHALKASALMGQQQQQQQQQQRRQDEGSDQGAQPVEQQQQQRGQRAGPSAACDPEPVQPAGGGLEQLEPHGATAGGQ